MDWQFLLEASRQFLSSSAFGTLIAAGAGAFAGALGAQAIISRTEKRQELTSELNSVRAALMLCFSICNTFVSLKRQHVRPIRNNYVAAQQEHEAFQERATMAADGVYELHAELRTLSPPKVPIEILERYVFERISISGRALAAAAQLIGAIDGTFKSIAYRNELVREFQTANLSPRSLTEKYLGLTTAHGAADERFRHSVTGLYEQTDDCIFFARILADDLLAYGNRLRLRLPWKDRLLRVRKLQPADWTIAERSGLLPTDEQYADWLRGFRTQPPWHNRIKDHLRSMWSRLSARR